MNEKIELYSPKDIVQGLGLSLRQVRVHIKEKRLVPTYRPGHALLFVTEDIERFLELRREKEDDCRYKILVWEPERVSK